MTTRNVKFTYSAAISLIPIYYTDNLTKVHKPRYPVHVIGSRSLK